MKDLVMEKAIADFYSEHGFIVNCDDPDNNLVYYGIEEYVDEREENDDCYEWIEDFNDTIDAFGRENGLKLFSSSEDVDALYVKPCDKNKLIDWILDNKVKKVNIFYCVVSNHEDKWQNMYVDYLYEIGYYVKAGQEPPWGYDINPDFEGEKGTEFIMSGQFVAKHWGYDRNPDFESEKGTDFMSYAQFVAKHLDEISEI